MKTHTRQDILLTLRSLTENALLTRPSEDDIHVPLLDMGANSLVLVQIQQRVEEIYGVRTEIPQLFRELSTIDALASHIEGNLPTAPLSVPPDPESQTCQEPAPVISAPPPISPGAIPDIPTGEFPEIPAGEFSSDLEQIFAEQLRATSQAVNQVVSRQIALLRDTGLLTESGASGKPTADLGPPAERPKGDMRREIRSTEPTADLKSPQRRPPSRKPGRKLPQQLLSPLEIRARGLTDKQQAHLESLIARYTDRTKTSKALVAKHRPVMVDSRSSLGFRFTTKEMFYPLAVARSEGARIWDMDGNEYLDITMGLGVTLFGHNPSFVREAMDVDLRDVIHLAHRSPIAGEAAERVTELTGMERVAFTNSGTEAVMAALRTARGKTGRNRFVMFEGSYHGHSDSTQVIAGIRNGMPVGVPAALGTPPGAVEDAVVLEYGAESSLEYIRKHAPELGAVIVEPVQSRNPALQPVDFLREVRKITEAAGTALIFDEMVTGFRVHPAGIQGLWGIQADIATYGKVVGGGMPIGVVAGRAEYMNGLDGGVWQYGDASYPTATRIMFGGTFCQHPLVMSATLAMLKELKRRGPGLQEELSRRAARLAERLNTWFKENEVPIRIAHFASILRFEFTENLDIFFYHMILRGVFAWEWFTSFLSVAHTDEDVEWIIRTVRESVADLREGGFLPPATRSPSPARAPDPVPTPPETAHGQGIPLTGDQRLLWALTQISEAGSMAYHVYTTFELSGPLRVQVLQEAVRKVVHRHESLRTVIRDESQHVMPLPHVEVPVRDLSESDDPERAVDEWYENEVRTPFDLAEGPIFRVCILRLGRESHLLVLTAHHILVDGLAGYIAMRDVAETYSALCEEREVRLPPAMQNREYVERQMRLARSEEMKAHETYWLERFAGEPPILDLPGDRPPPPIRHYQGDRVTLPIDADIRANVAKVGRREGCTEFMTLLSAYTVLLHRLTGQTQVVVGTPTAGRSFTGGDTLVGFCTNPLPVRSDTEGNPSFTEHLITMRDILLEAYQHQEYPFSDLIGKLDLRRDGSRPPLISTLFNLEMPAEAPEMSGLEVAWRSNPIRFTPFDLVFNIMDTGDALSLACDYNTDLFDPGTIARVVGHFQTLLRGIVAGPERKISELPLLTEAERHRILYEWNDTGTEYPKERCVHHLFEEQAERTPDAVAVISEDRQVTYSELDAWANGLAHHLRSLDVGPEGLVGICMERSVGMIVGMLGILKAGGAYVPIDPDYPGERIRFILSDADVGVLLTQERLLSKLPEHDAQRISLDTGDEFGRRDDSPPPGVGPDNTAYVIYTSGTTGRPKGALVTHHNLVRLFLATDPWFRFGRGDVWTLFHSCAFDFSVWEIWGALLYGGRLVIVPHIVSRSPEVFSDLLHRERVTVLNQTPSAFRQLDAAEEAALPLPVPDVGQDNRGTGPRSPLAAHPSPDTGPGRRSPLAARHSPDTDHRSPLAAHPSPGTGTGHRSPLAARHSPGRGTGTGSGESDLRLVIFGGEALEIRSLGPWFERHGDIRPQLVNMYGITETTVHVTHRPLTTDDLRHPASVIGVPIPDLRIHILDRHLGPVPVGVPGEMFVGGAGVCRGYLNRPELTRERFVRDPFGDDPGARLYRTGDLARYLPNGEIEFLGRADQQVKIRGFRIEPGEIEAVLSEHPDVREGIVIPRRDDAGGHQLVAYVVRRPGSETGSGDRSLSLSKLRDHLRRQLPEHMIPAFFVFMEALPLTPHGKTDHRALPEPDQTHVRADDEFVPPQTPEEEILADIWGDVLGIGQVGIFQNFFDVGGDSIRCISVVGRAKEAGLNLSVEQMFRHPTIHELSRIGRDEADDIPRVSPTQPFDLISPDVRHRIPEEIEDAYPLSVVQLGMLFHSEYGSREAVYHDIICYTMKMDFDPDALQRSLRGLADRHPILRTAFELSRFGEPLQLVRKTADIPLQCDDLRDRPVSEQEDALDIWMAAEKAWRFDASLPPMIRVHVHRLASDEFVLSLSFHHAILDGWSVSMMMTEFFQTYASALRNEAHAPDDPQDIPFRDFVELERATIEWETCRAFWREKVSDVIRLEFPRLTDGVSPEGGEFSTYEAPLSSDVSEGLRRMARHAKVPLKSVLLAAHMKVLGVLHNTSDVMTGLVVNSRPEERGGERTLGLFLNTLPFRLRLSGGTWTALVRETFAVEQELMPFRRYPLAEIQKPFGTEPLLGTMFNFVHFHVYREALNAEGVAVSVRRSFEETDFPFSADFFLDVVSSRITLELCSDTREQELMQIGEYYANTLSAMANFPDEPYETSAILSDDERRRLLVEWNDTTVNYPADISIHHLFEAQVERRPDAVAVVSGNRQLTYSELNARANQLAHHLISLGVGPERLVGICMERCAEMITGLLGILKAGGGYVPMDPAYPKDRLSFMLADSNVSVLLTQEKLFPDLPENEAHLLCPDNGVLGENDENPGRNITSGHPAYVIYTSGSVGRPKGVVVTHLSLVNAHLAWEQAYHMNHMRARHLQMASLSFDVCTGDVIRSLCSGGTLVLCPHEHLMAPDRLHRLMIEEQTDCAEFVPAVIKHLADHLKRTHGSLDFMRLLIVGSDLWHSEDYAQIRTLCPRARLISSYGVTEATIDSSFFETDGDQRPAGVLVPIGKPMANMRLHIWDRRFRLAPAGVPGELCISGLGLARSYLNRPKLTAEKFVPDPFSIEPGTRLYRTGDLARHLSDGNLELLGRFDHQVKVRGFRIELGEIGAVLSEHPSVRDSVVVARETSSGDRQLAAYIVGETGDSELRDYLKKKLPDHMIPAHVVFMETLPLTPNGKIDRKALPDPGQTESKETYVAPDSPTETAMALIWAEVLDLSRVGIHDNFFDLGGHSLLAMQVTSRLGEAFRMQIPVRSLFESPTISELAGHVEVISKKRNESLDFEHISEDEEVIKI